MHRLSKFQIKAAAENCSGCLRCQLACSERYTGSFNPLLSRVRVTLLGEQCAIEFGEDCDGCGACADQCYYDALRKETVK